MQGSPTVHDYPFRARHNRPSTQMLSNQYVWEGRTKLKISLVLCGAFLALLVSVAHGSEQPSEKKEAYPQTLQVAQESAKEFICEREFDAAVQGIKALSSRYPQVSIFDQEALIQKEFVKDEGGMYYGLSFADNFVFSKASTRRIDPQRPYLGLSFSLRTGRYGGQADLGQARISSIDEYVKERSQDPIQHRFPSGITLFASAYSDDDALRNDLYTLFNTVIDHLLEWESDGSAAESIPQTYEACRQAGKLAREVSALRCVYTLEPEPTERFTNCLLQAEAYRQWKDQSCQAVHDQTGYSLKCGNTLVGVFSGPCELIYYNPDYSFPSTFETCKMRGGEMGQTYTEKALCSVSIDLPPYYGSPNKTVYDPDVGSHLMEMCRNIGGWYELALGEHPQCRVTFLEANTQDACEAAQARWVDRNGVKFCTIYWEN